MPTDALRASHGSSAGGDAVEIRTRTQTLTLTFLGHFPPDRSQIKILPDDSPACLGSFLFRLTRNKAGATELVPLLIATDGH